MAASQNQQVAERSLKKSQDLIEFLIGDLHAQLEKLGRLEVMQSIGEKALGYFAELDPRQATDENIANRSKALYQIGSVYVELNEYDSATQAFAQSQELLSLLAQKYPNNFDYLYEYSQASFWVGYAYWAAERLDDAEGYFLEYLKIAKRLVELQPDNLDARMEVSYAYSNLGTLASNRGKTDLATQHFLDSINNSQIILAADPQNQAALSSSADAFSWLGNTYRDRLDLHKAIAYYRSEQRIFSNLVDDQFNYQNRYDLLLSSLRILGMRTYLGELDAALEGYYQALVDIQYLVNHDPANTSWRNSRVFTFANIAKIELLLGNLENSQQAFTKSYELEPNLPQNAEKIWADDYLERHYWYWRFLHKTQQTEQARDIAQQLMEQASPRAIKWQMRLASATDLPFDAPPFTETILMQGPDTVLAHLEYALFRNDQTTVERISQYLPTEMWANPELKTIKQKLSPTPNP
jgi:serine/threonine-protein kinase